MHWQAKHCCYIYRLHACVLENRGHGTKWTEEDRDTAKMGQARQLWSVAGWQTICLVVTTFCCLVLCCNSNAGASRVASSGGARAGISGAGEEVSWTANKVGGTSVVTAETWYKTSLRATFASEQSTCMHS